MEQRYGVDLDFPFRRGLTFPGFLNASLNFAA